MKKLYNQPEIELIVIEEEVNTATATTSTQNYDPAGVLTSNNADTWEW